MTRICLDTSAYSHFRRGVPALTRALGSAVEVAIPSIVIGELLAGFRHGAQRERNENELAEFLRHPIVSIRDVDVAAAEWYARIVSRVRADGTAVPTNDLWIAAIAARDGLSVLTCDSDFSRIALVSSDIVDPRARG